MSIVYRLLVFNEAACEDLCGVFLKTVFLAQRNCPHAQLYTRVSLYCA